MDCTTTSRKEERLNAWSHAVGIVLGGVGLGVLVRQSWDAGPVALFAVIVYSVTLLLMFTVSTCYHRVEDPGLKARLRVLDHICIYFLIAGTYTPVTLILLEGGYGWPMFYAVWAIALAGTVMKLFYTGKYEWLSLLLYLAMGWLIVMDWSTLWASSSRAGIILLFLGGSSYSLGIIFYANGNIRHNHFIWHLFVLAGALGHWFFIFMDVV